MGPLVPDSARRALIVSNSQGTSVGVPVGANYPVLTNKLLSPDYDVRWLSVSGWTISDILANLDDNVIALKPSLAVFQIGIVESAQRILSAREKTLLSLLPFGRRVTAALHKRRADVLRLRHRIGLSTRTMSPAEFARQVRQLTEILQSHGIRHLFLNIPPFSDGGQSIGHPYINSDVSSYNLILGSFEHLSLPAFSPSQYQPGTVHFTVEGHAMIADLLAADIRRRLPAAQ